ncbi:MAG: MFS transporter [Gammaproteobacteria bacterium]|nr:MAG: MFS transporter [Gammaproteobacteria bacterium]UCH39425.1 MAG: MFS transporter [Gammaproteobacteria bacterium]
MLFLGFSAGIPLLLIFSSLSLWLREAGVDRAVVTYFSWAALGYSFKFVWAPLVDQLPLPLLSYRLGRRRAWMLTAQLAIASAILLMASIDPQSSEASLTLMALAAVLLGFSSATQDIVIDAYRIESAEAELQAMMSATYIVGYRLAMLVAGAGSLYLAEGFGSTNEVYSYQAWQNTYSIMAAAMSVGIITTLVIAEPARSDSKSYLETTGEYARFLLLFAVAVAGFVGIYALSSDFVEGIKASLTGQLGNRAFAASLIEALRLGGAMLAAWILAVGLVRIGLVRYEMVDRTYIVPVRDFFQRYGWSFAWLLLALVGLYRISDIVLGVISNVFYKDLGFDKTQIADVVVIFGILMTIVGGLLGGLLAARIGVVRILLLGGVLAAATNLLFMLLAGIGNDIFWLYVVISADNLSAGIASAAFVAFLSSLTNVSFTAMQYAIFSSLMTLIPKSLGGYSGSMVNAIGYPGFFLLTAILGIPVLLLIVAAAKRFELRDQGNA